MGVFGIDIANIQNGVIGISMFNLTHIKRNTIVNPEIPNEYTYSS